MICIWSNWCHCHLVISCSSKIQNGLLFWCRLNQVFWKKRLLNGCSSSSSDNAGWWLIQAALCRWWCCCMADQLWRPIEDAQDNNNSKNINYNYELYADVWNICRAGSRELHRGNVISRGIWSLKTSTSRSHDCEATGKWLRNWCVNLFYWNAGLLRVLWHGWVSGRASGL